MEMYFAGTIAALFGYTEVVIYSRVPPSRLSYQTLGTGFGRNIPHVRSMYLNRALYSVIIIPKRRIVFGFSQKTKKKKKKTELLCLYCTRISIVIGVQDPVYCCRSSPTES